VILCLLNGARVWLQDQAGGDQPGRLFTQAELQAQALAMETPFPDSTPPQRLSSIPPKASLDPPGASSLDADHPRIASSSRPGASTLTTPTTALENGQLGHSMESPKPPQRTAQAASPLASAQQQRQLPPEPPLADTGTPSATSAGILAPFNLKKTVELPMDADRGDVADWGHTGEQEPGNLSASEQHSMSSGLSPREQAWGKEGRSGPRARVFSPGEGLSSLVHHTKKFVESQNLRRCGS
jgi:hypothetical protein